jgi:hypothetical protein
MEPQATVSSPVLAEGWVGVGAWNQKGILRSSLLSAFQGSGRQVQLCRDDAVLLELCHNRMDGLMRWWLLCLDVPGSAGGCLFGMHCRDS